MTLNLFYCSPKEESMSKKRETGPDTLRTVAERSDFRRRSLLKLLGAGSLSLATASVAAADTGSSQDTVWAFITEASSQTVSYEFVVQRSTDGLAVEFANAGYDSPTGQGIEGGTWPAEDFITEVNDDVIHAGGTTGEGFGDAFDVTGEVVAVWLEDDDEMWAERDESTVVDSDLFVDEPPTPEEWPQEPAADDETGQASEPVNSMWAFITDESAQTISYEMIIKPSDDELDVAFTDAGYDSPTGQAIEGGTWPAEDFIDQVSDDVIHAGGATGEGFGDAFDVTGEVVAVWLEDDDQMWAEQDGTTVVDSDLFHDAPLDPSEWTTESSQSTEPTPDFVETFDTGTDAFDNGWEQQTLSAVSSPARADGSGTALESRIPAGSHYGGAGQIEMQQAIGYEPDELHQRYWIYFGENTAPTDDCKAPGFSGDPNRNLSGTTQPNGYNGWSARGSYHPADGGVEPGFYVYHADQPDWWGTYETWGTTLERGRWYKIDQYIELNTPGENDGVLKGWVDGELEYESESWRWRDTDDLSIYAFWHDSYHGGNETPNQSYRFYTDEYQCWAEQGEIL